MTKPETWKEALYAYAYYNVYAEDGETVTKIDKPLEMFEEFYKNRSGSELDKEQKEYMSALVNSIWETF